MKGCLADPDSFRPDALTWAEDARALLARHCHYALIPSDNNETCAKGIFRAKIEMISEADVVIANLNPCRGCEPNSGTCFETGGAIALDKQVIAYLADTRPQLDKLAEFYGGPLRRRDGRMVDPDGLMIENFGLPINLTLGVFCQIFQGGLEDAVLELTVE